MSSKKRAKADPPVRIKREVSEEAPFESPLYRETWCPGEDFDDLLVRFFVAFVVRPGADLKQSESPARVANESRMSKGPYHTEAEPSRRASTSSRAARARRSSPQEERRHDPEPDVEEKRDSPPPVKLKRKKRRSSVVERPAPATPSESPDPSTRTASRKTVVSSLSPKRRPSPAKTKTKKRPSPAAPALPEPDLDDEFEDEQEQALQEDAKDEQIEETKEDVESFLSTLPIPMTRLLAHFEAIGCTTGTDLVGLADQGEMGSNIRRAVLDELEQSASLTKFERIVLEQGLKSVAQVKQELMS